MSERTTGHQVNRLVIETPQSYDEFNARYRSAVPDLDRDRLAGFVKRGASWQDVVADATASAPHGFFIFFVMDVSASMRLAGNTTRCAEYLMGNNTIAERMFRLDPIAMLYVPLRTLIFAAHDGPTTFVVEQPSSTLSSLGNAEINSVGTELDGKLATLLEALDVRVPEILRSADSSAQATQA
jgi:hypothetical protein